MKIITVEEHFESAKLNEAMAKAVGKPVMPNVSPALADYMQHELPTSAIMQDTDNERIAFMDAHGVDVQVLSYGNSQPQNLPADIAVDLCKLANDEIARIMSEHPDRYSGGLAVLPVGNPEAAAAELERAVKELGLNGTMLKGNYQGKYFDDEFFLPIFAKAAELDVPVYFHPSFIPQNVTDQYYAGKGAFNDVVTGIFSSAGFGWHNDVGIQVMRMVLSGIFDKLPNLKLISGHWGEGVPLWFERADDEFKTRFTGLKHEFSWYYKHNIWITPSGILAEPELKFLKDEVEASHLMFSVDYPYKQPENTATFLNTDALTDEEREAIAHENAEKIFHI